jgi:hypothetical protein
VLKTWSVAGFCHGPPQCGEGGVSHAETRPPPTPAGAGGG